jgi:hypothetical protein
MAREKTIHDVYDDMLDESGWVMVAGWEFLPSQILKNCDPIAYRTGFTDWCASLEDNNYDELFERIAK